MEYTTVGVNLTYTESFNMSGNSSDEMNERVMTELSRTLPNSKLVQKIEPKVTQMIENIVGKKKCWLPLYSEALSIRVDKTRDNVISNIVGLVLSILWAVLIVILNLAVIIIITRYPTRSRLYFFLFHLALADFMAGIIHCLPHSIERIIGYKYGESTWLAGEFLCKLHWTFGDAAVMTSNYVLACMSVDRAFAVCQPMKRINYRGLRAQRVAIACCWLFSIAVYSPYFKFVKTIPGYTTGRPMCIPIYPSDEDYKLELILKFVFLFCLPFTIIVISYGLLLTTIIRRSTGSFHGSTNPEHNTAQIFNGRIPKSKLKSIKLTLGIVISFIFCWSAHFTENFLGTFGDIQHPMFIIATTFYYLNSVANPILFFIYHKKKTSLSAKSSYSSYGRSKVDNSFKANN